MSSDNLASSMTTIYHDVASKPQVSVQPGSLEIVPGTQGFLGATVCFANGTRWKLTQALTHPAYANAEAPFEGRQVFECKCICDPDSLYANKIVAIMKVKYQIRSTVENLECFDNSLAFCHDMWGGSAGPEWEQKLNEELGYVKSEIHMATTPVEVPNDFTINEINALGRFRNSNSLHTPHLIDSMITQLPPGVDERGMIGGFAAFILMTKVPGERIAYESFWSRDKEEREEIRRAFKEALFGVWKQGIFPKDSAMRNLIWNPEEMKCYIVDFEDYNEPGIEDLDRYWGRTRPERSWGLDECLKPPAKMLRGHHTKDEDKDSLWVPLEPSEAIWSEDWKLTTSADLNAGSFGTVDILNADSDKSTP